MNALDLITAERQRAAEAALAIRADALAALAPTAKAEVFTSTDAWLEARAAGTYPIGGSTIPAILGLSPYAGPWDVWAERLAPEAASRRAINPADARRGHALEPGILAWLEAELHAEGDTEARVVHIDPAVVCLASESWRRCSPDGLILRPGQPPQVVEVKTTRHYRDVADWPTGAVVSNWNAPGLPRPDWVAQTAWNIGTCGLSSGLLVATGPTSNLLRVPVAPDSRALAAMVDEVDHWREAHLVWGAQPDRDASDACVRWVQQQMARRTFGGSPPTRIEGAEADAVWAWVQAQRLASEAKSAADKAKAGAVLAMEQHPDGAIVYGDGEATPARVVWQTRGKSAFIRAYDHHEAPSEGQEDSP